MECVAKRLSRSPAGIPHGVGYVDPFPVARACDLGCIDNGTGVLPEACFFTVCPFLILLYFSPCFVCELGKGGS